MSDPLDPSHSGTGSTSVGSTAVGGEHADDSRDSGPTIGSLLGDISANLSTLMRQEVALAKAEVRQEATKAGGAAGMLGGAGFAGYMFILFLSIAAWQALDALMPSGWAAFIVAVVWGIIAAVLGLMGRKKMQQINPTPEQTVETLQKVPGAIKPSPNNASEATR